MEVNIFFYFHIDYNLYVIMKLMRQLKICVFFLFCPFFLFSQDRIEIQRLYQSGIEQFKKNDFKQAEDFFTKVIHLLGEEPSKGLKMTYVFRGQARNNLGDHQLAINDYNNALQIDSTDAATYVDRGIAFIYLKDEK